MDNDIDISTIRANYATVNRKTWSRWMKLAKETFRDNGGTPPPVRKSPPPPKAKKRARTKQPAKKLPKPASGTWLPGHVKEGADNGDTVTIETLAGPMQTSVVHRWTHPPDIDSHSALANIDRLGEQYLSAQAQMNSAIRREGDGHVIVNPQSFSAALAQQTRISEALHRCLKESRDIDGVRRFVATLMSRLQDSDPKFRERAVNLLREASQDFVATHNS